MADTTNPASKCQRRHLRATLTCALIALVVTLAACGDDTDPSTGGGQTDGPGVTTDYSDYPDYPADPQLPPTDLPDPTGTPEFPLPDVDDDGLSDGMDYDGDTNMSIFDNNMDATNVWTDDDGY